MNSKERVLAAFEKKATSRVPVHHIGSLILQSFK